MPVFSGNLIKYKAMIIVIIAGGSGTRLWPLSTPEYPKHLLKINGDELSLLQHAYDRAKKLTDKIYVVSESSHIEHVKAQLTDLAASAFIVEPGRRGTANCIAAALAHIAQAHTDDEPVAFMHADHYIRDVAGFTHSFQVAEQVAAQEKRIVLVGVEPDHAATGFGYIEKGSLLNKQSFVFNVSSFKEKPDHTQAQNYLESGNYLWNGGYFVALLNTFVESMQQYAPELANNYKKLLEASPDTYKDTYLALESEAIDYALIEKVPDLLVVPASFDWMDLGSFGDLSKAVSSDERGNHAQGHTQLEEVTNSLVQNYEDKPIAVIGLDNVVVINTADGLVVARKDASQKVGEVSKRFTQQ
jgi:mannose-1-phosphate guanylyltransferase